LAVPTQCGYDVSEDRVSRKALQNMVFQRQLGVIAM
jgi:hypothetical protein